jgi:hypothetical protein
MRARSLLLWSCAGLLLGGALACGGGSSPTEPSGGYTPGWDKQWQNVSDPTNTYNFNPGADAGKMQGNLEGFEGRNGDVNDFRGAFNNRDFQISIDRDKNGTFEFPMTGFWENNNRIRLTSSQGTITIVR